MKKIKSGKDEDIIERVFRFLAYGSPEQVERATERLTKREREIFTKFIMRVCDELEIVWPKDN